MHTCHHCVYCVHRSSLTGGDARKGCGPLKGQLHVLAPNVAHLWFLIDPAASLLTNICNIALTFYLAVGIVLALEAALHGPEPLQLMGLSLLDDLLTCIRKMPNSQVRLCA